MDYGDEASWNLKKGDKVEIRMEIFPLKHRKKPLLGRVTNVDGSYILVRPLWCNWEVECYPCELQIVHK